MNSELIPSFETEQRLQMLKALGDETRLKLMLLLFNEASLCVCELVDAVELPQPTVSRQLTLLKHAGLVNSERRGKWIHYSLTAGLEPWVNELLRMSSPLVRGELQQRSSWCLDSKGGC